MHNRHGGCVVSSEGVLVSVEQLRPFVARVLAAAGVVPDEAATVADELVDAEACGYGSQGLNSSSGLRGKRS